MKNQVVHCLENDQPTDFDIAHDATLGEAISGLRNLHTYGSEKVNAWFKIAVDGRGLFSIGCLCGCGRLVVSTTKYDLDEQHGELWLDVPSALYRGAGRGFARVEGLNVVAVNMEHNDGGMAKGMFSSGKFCADV